MPTTTFGIALQDARVMRRVSQSKLAARAGFDHSYVSRLESGTRTPTREAVLHLAGALGLDAAGTDQLLSAAGFLPGDVASLLAGEPDLVQVLEVLRSDVPEIAKVAIRRQLQAIVDQVTVLREAVA